jgi:DNA-binding NtrC family response regulator
VRVNIVALLASTADRDILAEISGSWNWTISFADNIEQVLCGIRENNIGVVISDASDHDTYSWRQILREFETIPAAPSLIVTDRLGDDRLWAEVLNLGAYDLLVTPFESTEVFRIVSLAWLSWKARKEGLTTSRRPAASAHHDLDRITVPVGSA